ncbi:MAG: hypothetical protein ACTSPK_08990 [Candidatus Heimdallarchaeota archaeon]
MSTKEKNQKLQFNPEDSIFDLRIKQYKNTLLLAIICFVAFAGVFAGGMVWLIVFTNALGTLVLIFSFVLLFFKDYALSTDAETRSAYYQFLFGTCALVDIATEEDIPFFEKLLEDSPEKNKVVIKALMNLFARKHGYDTFAEFKEK